MSRTVSSRLPAPAACAMLPAELADYLGLKPAFRGRQVFAWLARCVTRPEAMTDLPAEIRDRLGTQYGDLLRSQVEEQIIGSDGTGKLKIRLEDGAAIEAVLLSDPAGRLTACLSTQVGCPMGCAFCKTATLGLQRNLAAHEIVEQFIHLSRLKGRLSNLVFMGMGEPLLNLGELRKAIAILCHEQGFHLSKRKITISTCGIVPGILSLADEGPLVRLAISLTVADDRLRSQLMPVNKQYDLASLRAALAYYQEKSGDRITLEAAVMRGVNTGPAAARQIAEWVGGLKVQVNIIPWNPVAGLPYQEPGRAEVRELCADLERQGLTVVQRSKKGSSVAAACGQLGETVPDPD